MMTPTRITAVSYLNTIPFIYGIEHGDHDLRAALHLSPPSGCAHTLQTGQADIGLIPVAAVPNLPDFDIITPYCIGAHGPVRTVVLASTVPLEEIRKIGLDAHSLTSVKLCRILASESWNISPAWEDLTDYSRLEKPKTGEAFVLIGDKVFENEQKFPYLYDLAAEWKNHTGLPFVFAVWVARKDVPADTLRKLEAALRFGVSHIREAIKTYGYEDRPYAEDYLTNNIDFEFDVQKRRALELYWQKGMKADPLINPG